MTRFPTFNVADSFVTVGVAVVILSPVILKKIHKQIKEEKESKNAAADETPKPVEDTEGVEK
jgi:signal peptidase II